MPRVACGIEYDGSAFRGWQAQALGTRTVQTAVEKALSHVAAAPVRVTCAGRTDTGVHAVGQVVHFDCAATRSEKAWLMGANTELPGDVAVRWARPVADTFHARHSARTRSYRYLILEGWDRPALWRQRALWSHAGLDCEAMQRAAEPLLGEHDFGAFRSAACQARHAVRRLEAVTILRAGAMVIVDVRGNAFLHNMVRILVGTLMAVGRGEQSPDWPRRLLHGGERSAAGMTVPPHGLYLLGPSYPAEFGLPAPPRSVWPAGDTPAVLS